MYSTMHAITVVLGILLIIAVSHKVAACVVRRVTRRLLFRFHLGD
jgi:hypothetical protein